MRVYKTNNNNKVESRVSQADLRERRRALVRAPGKARISVSIIRTCVASFSNSTSFFGIVIINRWKFVCPPAQIPRFIALDCKKRIRIDMLMFCAKIFYWNFLNYKLFKIIDMHNIRQINKLKSNNKHDFYRAWFWYSDILIHISCCK